MNLKQNNTTTKPMSMGNSKITEQQIQSKKIKDLEANGYYVIKLIRTNKNGIPDLLAIPKDSDAIFIEVKKPGNKPSKLQEYRMKELNNHGIKTEVYYGEGEGNVKD